MSVCDGFSRRRNTYAFHANARLVVVCAASCTGGSRFGEATVGSGIRIGLWRTEK